MKKVLLTAAVAGLFTLGAFAQNGAWNKAKTAGSQSQTQATQSQSTQSGSQSTWNQQKENAQEKASGIHDAVDITSGPQVQNLTASTATLTWTTNKEAATRVRYGTDRMNPAQHAYVPGGATQHSAQLTNLKPNTTYYYEIENRGGKDRFKGHFQTPAH